MTIDQIKKIYLELETKVKGMFSGAIPADNETIVQFFLVAFLGGVSGLPPRRSLDYALLKIRNYDLKSDNYYKSNKLFFNKYKTSEVDGLQSLDVPKSLNVLVKKWIKVNTGSDYFLFSSNGNPLTSPQITRILNKAFKKKVSCDMLRHIFLSDHHKDIPSIVGMKQLATSMGHSVGTAMEYIKK